MSEMMGTSLNGLGGLVGAGLTGYGMSMNPEVGNIPLPNYETDLQAIQGQMGQQRGMSQEYQKQLQDLYGNLGPQLMQNMAQQLSPTGAAGQQLMQGYNASGLLNSGAFNQGLAQQFAPIMQGLLQGQLGAQQGGLQQGYQTQSGLGMGELQRQFGIEDLTTQTALAKQIADMQAQAAKQQALIKGGTGLMGGK
jgi:hypothetical protein